MCIVAAALALCAIVPAFAVPPTGVISGKGTADLDSGATGNLDLWVAFSPTTKYVSKFKFSTPHPLGGQSWFKGSTLTDYLVQGPYPLIVGLRVMGTWNGTPAYCDFFVVDDFLGRDWVVIIIRNQFGVPQHYWNGVMTTGGFRVNLAP
jgi:hypothetical protein